ncbi:hypothetical protein X769_27590 [Mesorhizobium sp. LSJC268A00]|nr:hypothetical protein X769_27590 [Mesorhizobium sp. LSJC268A00]ESZ13457.1 hypothetical protein X735_18630 [Mesorhizobium sp. L2C085B000]
MGGAGRRLEISGDGFDQRRFAGTIVAHQAENLALIDVERHIVQRADGTEILHDTFETR